ncbi:uncharacterized protein LOC107834553 [Poecilia formosa]|uniref:uncharacterized protein LOC107834553 n=1 Tax=Poecilia formosa TaxID=48698 RepID=UPI0007B8B173|nr:PREDICTED: uncharacterized protein LOC107834553 [Poecilia formosa]
MKEEDQEVKVEEDQEDQEDQGLQTEVKAEETEEVNLAENHEHRQDPEPDRQDPEPDRQDPEPDRQDPEPDRQDPEPDRHTLDSTQTQTSASGLQFQETSGPLRCCPICQSGLWERLKGFHQVKNVSQTQLTWSAGHTNIQPQTEPTVDERGKESNRAKSPEGPGPEERRRMQPGCCTELFQAYKSRLRKLEWEKSELEGRVGRLERVLMGSKRSAAADGAEDGLQPVGGCSTECFCSTAM